MSPESVRESVLPDVNTSQENEICKETLSPPPQGYSYTAESREYMLRQAEAELDRMGAIYTEEHPELSTTKAWLSLNATQQSAHLSKCLDIIKCRLEAGNTTRDFEDPEELDATVVYVFCGLLPRPRELMPPPNKPAKKSGNHLLKTAIRHSALEKEIL